MKQKDSLLLYYGLLEDFEYLTDSQIGKLMRAIFMYEIYGEKPEFNQKVLYPIFRNVARHLDVNKEKYVERCNKNRESIKKRWNKEKGDANVCKSVQTNTNVYERIETYEKNTDTDTDTETDTETETETETDTDTVYVTDTDENSPAEKAHTHKKQYGKFSNVLLDDKQYEEMKKLYPTDYQQRIDSMSAYMKSSGKTYTDCFARLSTWTLYNKEEIKKEKEAAVNVPSYDIDAYMKQSIDLKYEKVQ